MAHSENVAYCGKPSSLIVTPSAARCGSCARGCKAGVAQRMRMATNDGRSMLSPTAAYSNRHPRASQLGLRDGHCQLLRWCERLVIVTDQRDDEGMRTRCELMKTELCRRRCNHRAGIDLIVQMAFA